MIATGLLVFVLLGASSDSRAPVPSPAALKEARTLVETIYQDELEFADEPGARERLAADLIRRSRERGTDLAMVYELLSLAREQALVAGESDTAWAAIREQTRRFRVDTAGVAIAFLEDTRDRPSSADRFERDLDCALSCFEDSIRQSDWGDARRLHEFMQSISRKVRGSTERIDALGQRLAELEEGYEEHARLTASLSEDSSNATYSYVTGRYRAFLRGDWKHGLPLLVRGDEKSVARVAARELKLPTDAAEQLRLADQWWDLAKDESPGCRSVLQQHAWSWYRSALAELDGAERKRASSRMLDVAAPPLTPKDAVSLDPATWKMRCWMGKHWESLPMDRTNHRVRRGVLTVRNTTGIYAFSQLTYQGRELDRDFILWLEVRGNVKTLAILPRDTTDRNVRLENIPSDNKWKKIVLSRRQGTVAGWIDGQPTPVATYNASEQLTGLFGVSLRSGQEIELRNLRFWGGLHR